MQPQSAHAMTAPVVSCHGVGSRTQLYPQMPTLEKGKDDAGCA